jgi:hypothetical protein
MDRSNHWSPNFQLAEDYINKNGLGYLEIVGELVCSVDEKQEII